MKPRPKISDFQNSAAARHPANQALFSEPAGKVSTDKQNVPEIKGKQANKYGNRTVEQDGETYDSVKEAKRAKDLRFMLQAGEIKWLARQVHFSIKVNGKHLAYYIADFLYQKGEEIICEDVKSEATRKLPVYRIKKRAMFLQHGIEIQEV